MGLASFFFQNPVKAHLDCVETIDADHGRIENSLHWCLDISFREDHCRIRKDHTAENMAILRHMAINPIKLEKSRKGGIQTKRLKAAWDNNYLMKIMPAYFFLRLSWIIWELRLTFVLGCRRR